MPLKFCRLIVWLTGPVISPYCDAIGQWPSLLKVKASHVNEIAICSFSD